MERLGLYSSLDPCSRLICLAVLTSAILLMGPAFTAVISAILLVILIWEGLPLRRAFRNITLVGLFSLLTAAIRFIGNSADLQNPIAVVEASLAFFLRLLSAYLEGRLLYATTSVSELRDATTRIIRRIPILRHVDIGLAFSLVICFIPLIFEEWAASLEAARSRGFPKRPGIARQSIVLAAFLRRLMLRAVATPEALFARGWTRDRSLAPLCWRKRDSVAMFICIVILCAAILRLV